MLRGNAVAASTRWLLVCGVVAGPLFVPAVVIQGVTRTGFDLGYHPLSLLSLGDAGWIQIANFVVTGVLFIACAAGIRRVVCTGRGSTWGPRLVGVLGVGLIVSGVFVTDAGAGFPPGAPAGAPTISWHGALHEAGFVLAVPGMIAGCLVFMRRFVALRWWKWVVGSVAVPVAVLVLAAWPETEGLSIRLLIATGLLFAYVGGFALRAIRGLPDPATRSA